MSTDCCVKVTESSRSQRCLLALPSNHCWHFAAHVFNFCCCVYNCDPFVVFWFDDTPWPSCDYDKVRFLSSQAWRTRPFSNQSCASKGISPNVLWGLSDHVCAVIFAWTYFKFELLMPPRSFSLHPDPTFSPPHTADLWPEAFHFRHACKFKLTQPEPGNTFNHCSDLRFKLVKVKFFHLFMNPISKSI